VRHAAASAFVLLLVSGCGGGDDEDAAETTTTATESEASDTRTVDPTATTRKAYEPPGLLFDGSEDDLARCAAVDLANFEVQGGDLAAAIAEIKTRGDIFGPQVVNDLVAAPAERIPIVAQACVVGRMPMLSLP
jgi:hypothetical protein